MPETEYFSVRADAKLVTDAAAVTIAKLGAGVTVDRSQLIRAALWALALGKVRTEDLSECVRLAELRRGWPARDDRPGRWITRANGPDYRARDE
jgi:hypothetical protein